LNKYLTNNQGLHNNGNPKFKSKSFNNYTDNDKNNKIEHKIFDLLKFYDPKKAERNSAIDNEVYNNKNELIISNNENSNNIDTIREYNADNFCANIDKNSRSDATKREIFHINNINYYDKYMLNLKINIWSIEFMNQIISITLITK